MIADLLNGVLGILLIYIAVLRQPLLHSAQGRLIDITAGVIVVVLALLALKVRDAWYSRAIIPLGVILTLVMTLGYFIDLPITLESWLVFWVGTFTSIIAIWGALYPRNLQEAG